ncbi:SulP family inorganic anion transporter [Oleidesulfovibrio alaskensis]|jgi:SulP family sulfate permease|uniref:SulP family inorganic anion transporter n=1 Tax=Oleidesulfovibrio alaskensis TaxID=58180 RepID=UPI001A556723|nr:sulfate permease [Oleidesulfovibrio alaskensis]MBL3581798.1 sulfate permease [Oleidesulfovibrio alaskensis]
MHSQNVASDREGFLPKAISVLRQGYSRQNFLRDLGSGATVGIVALPLAMAFAIASGTTPEKGLFTAIVAGFLISALGGSRYQIGGPTGAFVVIIFNIISRHGFDGLLLTTIMAGIILIIFGVLRLGTLITFIPYPVTTGFTAGIALLIFSSQINDFLGMRLDVIPPDFIGKWQAYFGHAGAIDPVTAAAALLTLGIIIGVRQFVPRIPAPVAAVAAVSVLAAVCGAPVETIGSRFGGIPQTLPSFALPDFSWAQVRILLPDALTVALLAGIESLLSCVVADGMTGSRHNANTELVAQGTANIASALFGGIPATGAIARTATNIRSGAFSPVSGMIHSAVLVLFVLLLAPAAGYIPLACLAAVLVVVAWDMSEIHKFMRLLRAPKPDVLVMCLTFGLTVAVDLTVAVNVGVVLASLLFMQRMSKVTRIRESDGEPAAETWAEEEPVSDVPQGVRIYEIDGPFFFGVADRFKSVLDIMEKSPAVFILRLRKVPTVDSTAINALELLHARCKANGTVLLLSGLRKAPLQELQRLGTLDIIGRRNIMPDINAALERARAITGTHDRTRRQPDRHSSSGRTASSLS